MASCCLATSFPFGHANVSGRWSNPARGPAWPDCFPSPSLRLQNWPLSWLPGGADDIKKCCRAGGLSEGAGCLPARARPWVPCLVHTNRVWPCMSALLELGKWLQEDQEVGAILGYLESLGVGQPGLCKTIAPKQSKREQNPTRLRPLGQHMTGWFPSGSSSCSSCPRSPPFP